jgi:cytochrome c peroxidase
LTSVKGATKRNFLSRYTTIGLALLMLGVAAQRAWTQAPDQPSQPGPLKEVAVPMPGNLSEFVADQQAAIVLGKALFWDQKAGSDGLACASCHFQAGADNRVKNQLNPGLRNVNGPPLSETFNKMATNGGGPNYTLKKADFPFHQLSDPNDRESKLNFFPDTDDVVSSQGVFHRDFASELTKNKKGENCLSQTSVFAVGRTNVRQAEPRNTPTTINAVFNFRNFWDGRANNIFNGRNVWGPRDTTAGVDPANSIQVEDASGTLRPFQVVIPDASLASQAVGPPLSDLEMSCGGRAFENIGQKLLSATPLSTQAVDPTDSVLGPYVSSAKKNATGLNTTYTSLIQKAFDQKFWKSSKLTSDKYPQMVKNFSLFWGLSIMLYEATLVSDDTPFDRYTRSPSHPGDPNAMTAQQIEGLKVFMGQGGCISCHKGAEFTGAATSLKAAQREGSLVEHMIMGDGNVSLYDSGFYNIGVRPTFEDIGAGGTDQFGNPLSWSRQALANAKIPGSNLLDILPDHFKVDTSTFQVAPGVPITPDFRDSVDGSFKVPTLRNVELTGPYFHNGGQATLEQVVDFYNRGGDSTGPDANNTTRFGPNGSNRAPDIRSLGLSATDKANLVAFLKALSDERVRWEMAPFDHPSLQVPNGHNFDESKVIPDGSTGYAKDEFLTLDAVGAAGRAAKKLPPLTSFEAGLK